MKRAKSSRKTIFKSPKYKQDSDIENVPGNWKRKLSCSEEDIILISSSDDDDGCGGCCVNDKDDDVIVISDSDSNTSNQSEDGRGLPNVPISTKTKRSTSLKRDLPAYKKEDCSKDLSDFDDDLPDVPIYIKAESGSLFNLSMDSKDVGRKEFSDFTDDSMDLPNLPICTKAEKGVVLKSRLLEHKEKNSSQDLSGFAAIDEETRPKPGSSELDSTNFNDEPLCAEKIKPVIKHPVNLEIVKRNMFNSIMLGNLKGTKSVCSTNPEFCVCRHSKDTAVHTGLIFQSLIETQMSNEEKLQSFSLRLLLRTVCKRQYLSSSLTDLLIKVLIGSKELNLSSIHDFYIGISILNKQLFLHPPCRPQMRQYYMKMSMDYFEKLLDRAEEALQFEQSTIHLHRTHEDPNFDNINDFSDLVDVARRKEREKQQNYVTQTKEEKLERIILLLKFFTEIFKFDTSVWLVKHWTIKCCPFRQDIAPILSRLTWKKHYDFGCCNQIVKKIFNLFSNSFEETNLHRICGDLIGLYASIVQRWEKACMPFMGPLCRDYCQCLYQKIRNMPKLVECISNLNPDWVKFLIISLHLGVDQPPNFYKVKEVIVQTLKDIKNENLVGPSPEKICFEGIRSMMGMLELKSSVPPTCELGDRVMEDEDLWFKESLKLENISENINLVTMALSAVKDQTKFSVFF